MWKNIKNEENFEMLLQTFENMVELECTYIAYYIPVHLWEISLLSSSVEPHSVHGHNLKSLCIQEVR